MIRVVLADDQHLVRGALAALLALENDIDVVAEVADGAGAIDAVRAHRADVVLLDIEMPGMDGLATAARLHETAPNCRVLIVTTFGRPGYLRRAMEAGAAGFVVKDTPAHRLAISIRRVHSGEKVIDPELAAATLSSGASPLTQRERDVVAASRTGAAIADIATGLSLSEGTVRNYLSSAITKLGARNRTQAGQIAERNGWL